MHNALFFGIPLFVLFITSMSDQQDDNKPRRLDPQEYEQEMRAFRKEQGLSREVQEHYKREALRKCNDLHAILLDCYEKKYFCGTEEKAFWDCYRRERVDKITTL